MTSADLKILDIHKDTQEAVMITFEIPGPQQKTFRFRPGQYITLELKVNGQKYRRPYSICSNPADEKSFSILVKRVKDGLISNYINDHLRKGNIIKVFSPQGNFTIETSWLKKRQHVFFAAGSGITPILSMIRQALQKEPLSKVALFYSNRNESGILLKNQLDELKKKYNSRFHLQYTFSSGVTKDLFFNTRMNIETCTYLISENIQPIKDAEYYLCGPEGFMDVVSSSLNIFKVPEFKINREYFNTAPASIVETAEKVLEEMNNLASGIEVVIDGKEYKLAVKANQCILDAAIEADLDANFSCRAGVCTSCKARVLNGKVNMVNSKGLSTKEIAEGYILTCQSVPLTSDVRVEYCI